MFLSQNKNSCENPPMHCTDFAETRTVIHTDKDPQPFRHTDSDTQARRWTGTIEKSTKAAVIWHQMASL